MVTDHSTHSNGGANSPRASRSSPWAAVVRRDSDQNPMSPPPENSVIDGSAVEAQPESSDDGNVGHPRRPVWNTPLNGVVEASSVMGGAISWPALSEATRLGPRPVSDGSAAPSQAPLVQPPPPPPQRQANTTNAHANNSTASNNNTVSSPRPRPRHNRGGGSSSGSGPSHNTFNRPSPSPVGPPPFPVIEVPFGMVPTMLDNTHTPVRGPRPVGGVGGGSHSHTGNDHSSPRNNSRRNNYGPRPRGDGPYHNNHGPRRDQERRDVHLPPQFVPPPMGYMPHPMTPGASPFIPPPGRPFPGQMGFDMGSPFMYVPAMPPESFRPMAMFPAPPHMPYPPANENPIVKQIDYYFSDENLVKDNFLRSCMDEHGWVPVTVIGDFRRVKRLTEDPAVILDSLRLSNIVEVQGDKLRRRDEWHKWVLSSSSRTPGPPSSEENVLATNLQQVSLNDSNGNIMMATANGEDTTEVRVQPDSEH